MIYQLKPSVHFNWLASGRASDP